MITQQVLTSLDVLSVVNEALQGYGRPAVTHSWLVGVYDDYPGISRPPSFTTTAEVLPDGSTLTSRVYTLRHPDDVMLILSVAPALLRRGELEVSEVRAVSDDLHNKLRKAQK